MEVGTLPLSGAACASGRATTCSPCVKAMGGGLSGLVALTSDESVLEVCIRHSALYNSTFFTFLPLPLLIIIL